MWLAQSTASGMVPWLTWLGGKPEDRRWRSTCEEYFGWHAAHERHLLNERSVADIGLLFSQRTNAYYQPHGDGDVTDYLQGWYCALLEGRFAFDFVHEQAASAETLGCYPVIVLPNAAMLSDAQCQALIAYVEAGGNLVATFESGRYDEWGNRRPNPAFADLFGATCAGDVRGAAGGREHVHFARGHLARIEKEHPLLDGFADTEILPAGEFRVPVAANGADFLSIIEPYPSFPPEMVYSENPRTNEPAVMIRRRGKGQAIWFTTDIDRSFWRSTNGDLGRLMRNALQWLLGDRQTLRVEGQGLVEVFAWRTKPGYAVHLLNYTSPNALGGWVRETILLGPQKVTLRMKNGERVLDVQTLQSGDALTFTQTQGCITFTLPRIGNYEVAALVVDRRGG